MVKVRNFGGDASGAEEDPDDIWSFPIGWNRKVDGDTGLTKEPQDLRFLSNAISTAKYTCFNFVPFNLCYQLTKGPNIYYIFMSVLQCIPQITISGGSPTNLPPLLFLMLVSMVKDFVEDKRRRAADEVENCRITQLAEPNDLNHAKTKQGKKAQLAESLLDKTSSIF